MKITIINCFETYEKRIDLLYEYFDLDGHEVSVIQSKFMHFEKKFRNDNKKNFKFIDAKPYYRNLSISRIKSHYFFSRDALKVVEEIKPDLLYVILPPNSLAKFANKYKMKNENVKLYFDIMDLWPEAMPVGKLKLFPAFKLWGNIRNKNLKNADCIITECGLYRKVLHNTLKNMNVNTLYLARKEHDVVRRPNLDMNLINLCYLGSINNIIDISGIVDIINEINKLKPVVLHIIGGGENEALFINEVKKVGAKVVCHGNIYDSKLKQEIFDKCQFGFNMMKKDVCVGLTMKSIDYFEAGLPIINNIQEDTYNIVDLYNIGFNVKNKDYRLLAQNIVSLNEKELLEMREQTIKVFRNLFSLESFNKKLDEILNK